MSDALDVTDPALRALAERNHRPEELWSGMGDLITVCCDTCHQTWPCATKQALDAVKSALRAT